MEPPRQAGVRPRIQYTQTKDGVSIAFWTMGSEAPGTPVRLCELRWREDV